MHHAGVAQGRSAHTSQNNGTEIHCGSIGREDARSTNKTTSLKVDRKAPPSSTKMVNKFQPEVLGRVKTSKRTRRSHTCPICMVSGHHTKTCRDVLSAENRERSLAYCRKLRHRKIRCLHHIHHKASLRGFQKVNDHPDDVLRSSDRRRVRYSSPEP